MGRNKILNRHERQAIESYDKIADTYNDSFEGRFTLRYNLKLADVKDMPDDGRLLDIACGNGRFLKILRQRKAFDGYGADISGEMVKAASRDIPDITFRMAPCNNLPFEDRFFDVVTVCAAFHHFPDIIAFAKETRRVIKPGGKLYIAEIYYSRFFRVFINPIIRFHPSGDVKFYEPQEITALLQGNGFICEPPVLDGEIMIITATSE
jgi:ubiquinone/menaquinone biosynthesis C-methylase UbiE